MRAHVRLQSPDPAFNVFLADHDVTVEGDEIQPIRYGGRLFVFLRKMVVGSYQPGVEQEAYVFTDSGPISETA